MRSQVRDRRNLCFFFVVDIFLSSLLLRRDYAVLYSRMYSGVTIRSDLSINQENEEYLSSYPFVSYLPVLILSNQ